MCAEPTDAEDMVADRELADGCAHCRDLSGQLAAQDPPLRPAETEEDTDEEWICAAPATVGPVDGCGVDLDQDLIVLGHRSLDVCEPQNLRRPVRVVDHCSHGFPFPSCSQLAAGTGSVHGASTSALLDRAQRACRPLSRALSPLMAPMYHPFTNLYKHQ